MLQSFSRPLAVRRTGKRTASQTQKKAGESGSDSDSDYVLKYDEDDFIDDDGSFFTATQTGKGKAKAPTKGKGKGKGKTTTSRSSGGNPKVLLISLKSGKRTPCNLNSMLTGCRCDWAQFDGCQSPFPHGSVSGSIALAICY